VTSTATILAGTFAALLIAGVPFFAQSALLLRSASSWLRLSYHFY
jgi:hypothetical protein